MIARNESGNGSAPELPERQRPHVDASPTACRALNELCDEHGPHVIVLRSACAAPSIAHVLAEKEFAAREDEVLIGRVADCPVYAYVRDFDLCPHDAVIVELRWPGSESAPPVFVTRTESEDERGNRLLGRAVLGGPRQSRHAS
jgi:uncharacterized protein (DUF779 family)